MNLLKKLRIDHLIVIIAILLPYSCNNKPIPKPKAYPRVIFPERDFLQYTSENCPFAFQYPSYAVVQRDSLFFNKPLNEDCWLNIEFPGFNSTLHLTYKNINEHSNLLEYIEDTRKMTYKHTKKADYIDEIPFHNKYNASGIIYEVGGDAASSYQFFITDKESHFLRGSLYFSNIPNADSLKPVINFIKEDISQLIETFRWS